MEDPNLIAGLIQKALSGNINIMQRKLLAASPEVQKQIKELTTTKQLLNIQEAGQEVVLALTMLQKIGPNELPEQGAIMQLQTMVSALVSDHENLIVASDFEKFRALDLVLEESVNIECILDLGSQIVELRKKIWEQLSAPVWSDLIMTMESANGTTDNTMGVI
ncbi:hypothetical protein Hypma_008127 [Hypsizygus marmoreus]|uniref:Uncharacterized protein n=1 Tax=Hypsizygus marmoreus TaxID=39966 RepID=A0A369JXA7_HYPMA|nr:hypothetical protein Hypma_008127 [Hypsizygus marmoreus]